ncbi:hypothetical protein HK405_015330, partial [Cladochytrium tenue]
MQLTPFLAAAVAAVFTAFASPASAESITIIQPYSGHSYSFSDTIQLVWSVSGSGTNTVVFDLEDLRNGAATGQALSPSLGNASSSATTFTTAALSSLFTSAVVTTGSNYSIRGTVAGTSYYSPQFSITVSASSSTSSTTSSKSSTTGAASRSVAAGGAAVAGVAAAAGLVMQM